VLLGGMVFMFLRLPTSFLPLEDRGMFLTSVQLPSGATQQQTLKVVQKVEDYFLITSRPTLLRFSLPWALAREATVRTSRACLSA
jgi:multidrug efflux pump subunit AcrB